MIRVVLAVRHHPGPREDAHRQTVAKRAASALGLPILITWFARVLLELSEVVMVRI